jgi:hypothetical protein
MMVTGVARRFIASSTPNGYAAPKSISLALPACGSTLPAFRELSFVNLAAMIAFPFFARRITNHLLRLKIPYNFHCSFIIRIIDNPDRRAGFESNRNFAASTPQELALNNSPDAFTLQDTLQ